MLDDKSERQKDLFLFLALNPRFTFPHQRSCLALRLNESTYRVDEDVHWRVINLDGPQRHPMHLHGFYFTVDSLGDGLRDAPFDEGRPPQ